MKKRFVFILVSFFVLFLMLTFVSAFSFQDFFQKISGKTVETTETATETNENAFQTGTNVVYENFNDGKLERVYGLLPNEIQNQQNNIFPFNGINPEQRDFIISSQFQQFYPENLGYIIQFQDEPLASKEAHLDEDVLENKITKQSATISLKTHSETLEKNKDNAKTKIFGKINEARKSITGNAVSDSGNVQILGEYEKVFNGIALDISAEEAQSIKDFPEIKNIYPNNKVNITLEDSVPLINADDVWKLDANGKNCATSGKPCLTGKGITIGIIDTGVDYTHEDLGNGCFGNANCKVVSGWDFSDNDTDPMDYMGHGTHVAATAAGNGVLKGVAPDAKIVSYKVFPNSYASTIISAIDRSADPNQDNDFSDHLDVISLSLGGRGDPDDAMSQSIDNAVSVGVVAVIAAGNSGPYSNTIGSPGTARKAITVAASDKNDLIAGFSSRGPVSWIDATGNLKFLIKPDVAAPGVDICAAQWDSAWSDERCLDDKHVAISGTSMATPHVSGAVALIKQAHPSWTPNEIKFVLRNTAIDLKQVLGGGRDAISYRITEQGYGRIDVLKAVKSSKPPIAILSDGKEVSGII